jgi:hypothetical protein
MPVLFNTGSPDIKVVCLWTVSSRNVKHEAEIVHRLFLSDIKRNKRLRLADMFFIFPYVTDNTNGAS